MDDEHIQDHPTEQNPDHIMIENDHIQHTPDRISALPDELLLKILSNLETTKAVQTGILAQRWKTLWTHLDDLCFRYPFRAVGRIPDFLSFISDKLTQFQCPSIKSFKVSAYDQGFNSIDGTARQALDKWLHWAVERNVEFLDLNINNFEYPVHECFYKGSSFVVLNIQKWKFALSDAQRVHWVSLKNLSMTNVSIDDQGIEKILAGSPVLETLSLSIGEGVRRLNIVSGRLRRLDIWLVYDETRQLEINAPWLKELAVSGNIFSVGHFDVVNLSSLIKAEIHARSYYVAAEEENDNYFLPIDAASKLIESVCHVEAASKLIESVCHVEELTLGSYAVQVLSKIKLSGERSPVLKCKHLRVYLPLLKCELPGIVCLLENSPHLETFVLQVTPYNKFDFHGSLDEMCGFDGEEYLYEQMGDLTHLKNLEVAYCRHNRPEGDYLSFSLQCFDFDEVKSRETEFCFELVICMLRNARVLEKLAIVSEKRSPFVCQKNCEMRYVNMLSQELLGICLEEKEAGEWEFRTKKLHSKLISSEFIFPNRSVCEV